MTALGYARFVLWITISSTPVDSAHVARLLAQLRQSDSAVCAWNDPAAAVRHTAEWALDQLDLEESPRPRPKARVGF